MTKRLDFIDCLRGVAICGVVLVHSGQLIVGLPGWLQSFTAYSGAGVELFFLLSALTLLSVYKDRDFEYRTFFIRRFFRLSPMFYLGALGYLLLNGIGPSFYAPQGISARQIVATLLYLHGWMFDSINSVVPGGWSIADEAMFYLLFPLLLMNVNTGRKSTYMLVAAVLISRLSFVFTPKIFAGLSQPELLQIFAGFWFPTQFVAFICGFAVYFLLHSIRARPQHFFSKKFNAHTVLAITSVILFLLGASNNKTLTNYLLTDLVFILFVSAVSLSQSRIIVNSILRHIGMVSYSLYIVHFALIQLFETMIVPEMGSINPCVQLGIVFGVTMIVGTAIATLTHIFIELPMIKVGTRISKRTQVNISRPSEGRQ